MNRLYQLFIKTIFLSCLIANISPHAQAAQRIVGGIDVASGRYPWMAAIANAETSDTFDAFFCGGTLIDKDYVLTAAHCLYDFENNENIDLDETPTDVVLGTTVLGDGSGQRLRIEKFASHPKYDIALVKLEASAKVEPIDVLMPGDNSASPGTTATVIGWGATAQDVAIEKLQQIRVPIISSAACKRAYPEGSDYGTYDQAGELCAGLTHGGKDSCQGDSGGPLFVTGQDGRQPVLAGVVSHGYGCALPGFPGVYARVSSITDWIEAVKANGGNAPGDNGDSGGDGGGDGGTELTAKFKVACDGLKCSFDARRSTAGDTAISDYVWVLGENRWKYGRKITHRYRRAGTYKMTLYAIDEIGRIDRATRKFSIPATENDGLASQAWSGKLTGNRRVALPGRDGISLGAGQLKVLMAHNSGRDFDLDIQMKDDATGRWKLLRRAATGNTTEVINLESTRAGQYRFIVHARRGKGAFRVVARHP